MKNFSYKKKLLLILGILFVSTSFFIFLNFKNDIFREREKILENPANKKENLKTATKKETESHSKSAEESEKIINEKIENIKILMKKFCSTDEENKEIFNLKKTNISCKIKSFEKNKMNFFFKRTEISSSNLNKDDENFIIYSKEEFLDFIEKTNDEILQIKEIINSPKNPEEQILKTDNPSANPDTNIKKKNLESTSKYVKNDIMVKFFKDLQKFFIKIILLLRNLEIKILSVF